MKVSRALLACVLFATAAVHGTEAKHLGGSTTTTRPDGMCGVSCESLSKYLQPQQYNDCVCERTAMCVDMWVAEPSGGVKGEVNRSLVPMKGHASDFDGCTSGFNTNAANTYTRIALAVHSKKKDVNTQKSLLDVLALSRNTEAYEAITSRIAALKNLDAKTDKPNQWRKSDGHASRLSVQLCGISCKRFNLWGKSETRDCHCERALKCFHDYLEAVESEDANALLTAHGNLQQSFSFKEDIDACTASPAFGALTTMKVAQMLYDAERVPAEQRTKKDNEILEVADFLTGKDARRLITSHVQAFKEHAKKHLPAQAQISAPKKADPPPPRPPKPARFNLKVLPVVSESTVDTQVRVQSSPSAAPSDPVIDAFGPSPEPSPSPYVPPPPPAPAVQVSRPAPVAAPNAKKAPSLQEQLAQKLKERQAKAQVTEATSGAATTATKMKNAAGVPSAPIVPPKPNGSGTRATGNMFDEMLEKQRQMKERQTKEKVTETAVADAVLKPANTATKAVGQPSAPKPNGAGANMLEEMLEKQRQMKERQAVKMTASETASGIVVPPDNTAAETKDDAVVSSAPNALPKANGARANMLDELLEKQRLMNAEASEGIDARVARAKKERANIPVVLEADAPLREVVGQAMNKRFMRMNPDEDEDEDDDGEEDEVECEEMFRDAPLSAWEQTVCDAKAKGLPLPSKPEPVKTVVPPAAAPVVPNKTGIPPPPPLLRMPVVPVAKKVETADEKQQTFRKPLAAVGFAAELLKKQEERAKRLKDQEGQIQVAAGEWKAPKVSDARAHMFEEMFKKQKEIEAQQETTVESIDARLARAKKERATAPGAKKATNIGDLLQQQMQQRQQQLNPVQQQVHEQAPVQDEVQNEKIECDEDWRDTPLSEREQEICDDRAEREAE